MAILAYTNIRTLAGGYELTALTQEAKVSIERTALDVTTMASAGWEESIAGLRRIKANIVGFWDANATDGLQYDAIGAASQDLMILPTGGADAESGFIASGMRGTYEVGGKVGDAAPFSTEWVGNGIAAKGTVLKNGAITATSTGTIMQLGAITAAQTGVFQLQVTAISGTSTPTITVIVQSAALVGFGSPTTRASFTARTTVGSQTISLAGPVTDAFWRVSYTVTGTNPSLTTAVVAGIVAN